MDSKYLYNFDKLEGESDYELQAVRIVLALERDNLEAYLEEEKKPVAVTTKSSNTIDSNNTIEIDTIAFESYSKIELDNIAKKEAKKVSAILKSIYYDRLLLHVIYIVKPYNIQIALKKLYSS